MHKILPQNLMQNPIIRFGGSQILWLIHARFIVLERQRNQSKSWGWIVWEWSTLTPIKCDAGVQYKGRNGDNLSSQTVRLGAENEALQETIY